MDENASQTTELSKSLSITSNKAQESDIMSIQLSQHFVKETMKHDLLLHEAAIKNDVITAKKLIDSGIDINSKSHMGRCPLHWAISHNHIDIVEMLIQAKCDIEATDKKGRSALMIAAAFGFIDVVSLLVFHGAIINRKDKNGNTALHLSVMGNHIKMCQYLLDKGAEINFLNNRKQTALVVAAEMGHTDVAELLISYGADLLLQEKSGRTALYVASRGSFQAIVDMIIKAERDKSKKLRTLNEQTLANNTFEFEEFADIEQTNHCEYQLNQMRKILWNISRNHLQTAEWKKLARHWEFTEQQIKAIEHQYTGKTSYKDHCYRMMLIWLHGLPNDKNAVNELYNGLLYINRKDVAEKIKKKADKGNLFNTHRFGCQCLPEIPANICNYCSIL